MSLLDRNLDYMRKIQTEKTHPERFILQCGAINDSWQAWNHFWRDYFFAEVVGGSDIRKMPIVGINPTVSEECIAGFLMRGNWATPIARSAEHSWGSRDAIQTVANKMNHIFAAISPNEPLLIKSQHAASALALFTNTVDDLWIIRNCSIHFHKRNAARALGVKGHYSVPDYTYPTDVLFGRTLGASEIVIEHWIEDMKVIITLMI